MFTRTLIAAGLLALAGTATSASTLTGTFSLAMCHATNLNGAQSSATFDNFAACQGGTLGGTNLSDPTVITQGTATYTGDIKFGPGAGTISDWLDTGAGIVGSLDAVFGDLLLSKSNINANTATTTFFQFTASASTFVPNAIFKVTHDDGIEIAGGVGGFAAPTVERTTFVDGYTGPFTLLYVATNGNPSILEVEVVPLPAAGWMLLAGLGGIAALKRRRKAA